MIAKNAVRVALAYLAVQALWVGLWACFWPRSFYDDFPGIGHSWVSPDGPYNEHLVRDVGELNLALAVVTVWALVVLSRRLVMVAAAAWFVSGAPHLVYHLRHQDALETTADKVTSLGGLALAVVVPVLLFWTAWRSPAGSERAP